MSELSPSSLSYLSSDSISDAKKILDDEYMFDIWHDFKKFGSTVCDLPELNSSLGSLMSNYQFIEYYESLTKSKYHELINRDNINNDNSSVIRTELPKSSKPEEFFSMIPFEMKISELSEFANDYCNIPIKQLKKDLERDKIIINGNRLIGAAVELDGIIQVIEEILDRNLINCQLPLLPFDVKNEIILHTLRLSTRTYSGGIAFQALRHLLDMNECILIPLSNLARSIGINISMGPFLEDSSNNSNNNNKLIESHGIKIQVQVRSFYQVTSHLQAENIEIKNDNRTLEVIYQNTIGVKLDSSIPMDINTTISNNSIGTLLFQFMKN